jgi:hypothetical protein
LSNSRAACGREFDPFWDFARPERFELPTLRFEA